MSNEAKDNKGVSVEPDALEDDDKDIKQQDTDTTAEAEESAQTGDEPGNGSADDIQRQLEVALTQAEEYEDQFLRAKAESDNARRRAQADVANARKFAVEDFAREMLNVKDSLDLARNVELSEADSDAVKKMLEGLDLTLRQMDGVFERFSLQIVDPAPGDKFNPEQHQAMTTQENADVPANHIVTTVQKGFMLHDRLLRPAMVIVAKTASVEQDTEND